MPHHQLLILKKFPSSPSNPQLYFDLPRREGFFTPSSLLNPVSLLESFGNVSNPLIIRYSRVQLTLWSCFELAFQRHMLWPILVNLNLRLTSIGNAWGNSLQPFFLLIRTLRFTYGKIKFGKTSKSDKTLWPLFYVGSTLLGRLCSWKELIFIYQSYSSKNNALSSCLVKLIIVNNSRTIKLF